MLFQTLIDWLVGTQPAQLFCQFVFISVFALVHYSREVADHPDLVVISKPGRLALGNALGSLVALAAYQAATWAVGLYSGTNPLLLLLVYVAATPPLYLAGGVALQIVVQAAARDAVQEVAQVTRLGAIGAVGHASGPQRVGVYLLFSLMALFGYQAAFRIGGFVGIALVPN